MSLMEKNEAAGREALGLYPAAGVERLAIRGVCGSRAPSSIGYALFAASSTTVRWASGKVRAAAGPRIRRHNGDSGPSM